MLFLSDIFPTGYMAAENCNIQPGDTVAVWGCGPVGQFAIKSAYLLGAERVIAIDRFPYRLQMARERAGAAETINYEEIDVREALAEGAELFAADLLAATPAQRSAVIPRGQSIGSVRRTLRRSLEHGWEHFQEIRTRLGA